jgi:hypothetical protein
MDKITALELTDRIKREMPDVQTIIRAKRHQRQIVYGIEALHTRRHLKQYFSEASAWKSIRNVWRML